NVSGGHELYSRDRFRADGIELQFIQSRPIEYAQFGAPFVPWLSIVDVLMFNPVDRVRGFLTDCEIA
ncbi:MAG TPA: WbqC family protein, partial [Vicinamibacterales bacterium]|nr:WbqC family protein [Vicinamibacterales bacterium]